ncbi:hypothetical protein Q5N75_11535, partial [Acinetobacter baumannii]|nr:hypothetical protein [Acinetobacter baumannii]MDO7144887.1 hypothetical protein [Acinetobacter baumannii]
MAIRRRRRMFILFAERKVGEQHGPASGAPASDQSVTPVQQGRWLFTEEDVEHVDLGTVAKL